jgi:hypothetical protein
MPVIVWLTMPFLGCGHDDANSNHMNNSNAFKIKLKSVFVIAIAILFLFSCDEQELNLPPGAFSSDPR